MKKLSKLKLHNVAILNDDEMKCITGGYGESTYVSDSPLCGIGEHLYQCFADFQNNHSPKPETTYSLGAVCAKNRRAAMDMTGENLRSQGLGVSYAFTCN